MLTKYIATITLGDNLHEEGEEHEIQPWNLYYTQKFGLKLLESEGSLGAHFRLYPCKIKKVVYRLEPIEITTIEGGDRLNDEIYGYKGKVGRDYEDYSDHDWYDRWP